MPPLLGADRRHDERRLVCRCLDCVRNRRRNALVLVGVLALLTVCTLLER